MSDEATPSHGRFDLAEIASGFPDTADTLLVDRYLTREQRSPPVTAAGQPHGASRQRCDQTSV